MKTIISGVALAAALALAGATFAQVPSGGADAKGNAPLKRAHTINDGGAKHGATSFTQGEARKHIEHAGYSGVSPLVKGKDGVWRGTATKDGASIQVGLDFKGNVVEAGPAGAGMPTGETHGAMHAATSATTTTTTTDASVAPAAAGSATAMHHRRHHMRRRHMRHVHVACATPGPNGAACSGIDRNMNGVSDKEDHAIKAGAKP